VLLEGPAWKLYGGSAARIQPAETRRTQLKPPFHLLNPRKRLVAVRLRAPPYAERPDYLPRFPTHQRRMVDVAM